MASSESIKGFSSESVEVNVSHNEENKSKESSKSFYEQIIWSLDKQEKKEIGKAYLIGTV